MTPAANPEYISGAVRAPAGTTPTSCCRNATKAAVKPVPSTRTRGIVFDLDETLIDRTATLRLFARQLWTQQHAHIDLAEAQFVDQFIALDGYGYAPKPQLFESTAALISSLDAEAVAGLFHQQVHTQPILFDHTLVSLRHIREQGWPVGIVTNGSGHRQRVKIVQTGLAELVDYYVISEEFGTKKPDPRIFQEIAEQLRIDPQQSWFVGDHPILDIWGSSQYGFNTIWIPRHIPWPSEYDYCATWEVPDITGVATKIA